MYNSISFYGPFNERTGYGVHGSRFAEALESLISVYRNQPGGEVSISLIDSVSIQSVTERLPYPSILYNVWESSLQPDWFIDKLQYFDQLWVASEAQRAWSIAQGIPEEFVKVVPEGVDPNIYKPGTTTPFIDTFDFLVIGQWQPRKSTLEIIQSFLKAFPDNPHVRLYLSVDTLFPSDEYKSTEERLVGNGIFDDRIIPVHFEEREAYIRRLQNAHCYVQCSRSEGFGLPGIEAMACGTISIMENWGGSTEYSTGALLVSVPELKKPEGIYGGWDVPGKWGEPDYNELVKVMKDAYNNYAAHKTKALKTSEYIRTNFSWEKAAQKAWNVLEELYNSRIQSVDKVVDKPVDNLILNNGDVKRNIIAYARKMGYEITDIKSRSAIFVVDCHPDTQGKMDILIETIGQIKALNYPILITSHFILPPYVIEMVDYYIYDKRDISSGDDRATYWAQSSYDGMEITRTIKSTIPCHALAALHNVRNAVDFCMHKYDWIYTMGADVGVDLELWLEKVHLSDKDLITTLFEGTPETFSGLIYAGKSKAMDKILRRIDTWEEFAHTFGDERFNSEKATYRYVTEQIGIENVDFIDIDIENNFRQLDGKAMDKVLMTEIIELSEMAERNRREQDEN